MMRKLLMASAAIFGATGGIALAQAPAANQAQGQLAAPWVSGPAANNNNNTVGIANSPTGYAPNYDATPTPGTVVIRLNGRVEAGVTASFTSGDRATSNPSQTFAPASGSTILPTVLTGSGGFKVNPIGVYSYMRLYPGVDGMATNGLRYGAAIELREDFNNPNNSPAFSGSAYAQGFTAASSPSGYSYSQTVYVRRAFTYVGSDRVGIVRVGQTDGVIGLFDNGQYSTQLWDSGIGNFNGGAMQAVAPGAGVAIPFAWLAQAGSEYSNQKIVYLTPQFYGFDFGVQYAPSMGNALSNAITQNAQAPTLCVAASVGCVNTSTGVDPTRWLNQVAVGLRYQGPIGPVNFGAYVVYETAGKESIPGGGITAGGPGYTAGVTNNAQLKYDNLSFVNAATFVTIPSLGVTWAFDYIGGALNGQLAMRPAGGAPENAWLTGLTYRNGPWVLGAEIGVVESQGQANLAKISQRKETEIAFGGTYNAAPGLAFVAEFMHTERHQGGFDFVNNVVSATANGTPTGGTRDSKGNGVLLSTVITW